jgi:ketosteroid isomerase-like protein
MKTRASVLAVVAFIFGAAGIVGAQDKKDRKNDRVEYRKEDTGMNNKEKNLEVILEIFNAIERRDISREQDLVQPDIELHWPPSLPYGGTTRGMKPGRPGWGSTWIPLQPTEAERRMDPRVVAANDEEVVVLWHQRGLTAAGDKLDVEVLGLYRFRDGKLARAQMFYFDTASVLSFLAKANSKPPGSKQ